MVQLFALIRTTSLLQQLTIEISIVFSSSLSLNFPTLSVAYKVSSFGGEFQSLLSCNLFLILDKISEPLLWIGGGDSDLSKSDILFYEQNAVWVEQPLVFLACLSWHGTVALLACWGDGNEGHLYSWSPATGLEPACCTVLEFSLYNTKLRGIRNTGSCPFWGDTIALD